MLEQIVLVSLSLAGLLFLLYKWNMPFILWAQWCDFCFLFWGCLAANILYTALLGEFNASKPFVLALPETVAAYYIFLRIYHGTTTKR